MDHPWKGAARPASRDAFRRAAKEIGCEPETIEAIWAVESGGRAFLDDASLIRRFEPHKMPGADMTWRESRAISPTKRGKMFLEAYARNPSAALRATSWCGCQIMGFNHREAGFKSPFAMVRAMADGADAHFEAFVALAKAWGLASVIRAHDWRRIEDVWNGGGQGGAYARNMEAEYRRLTGKASPAVLHLGASGKAVRRLQEALGVDVDGRFGKETESAVRKIQEARGLLVDGIAGKRTWAELEAQRDAKPVRQPTPGDQIADRVGKWAGTATTAGTAAAAVESVMPGGAFHLLAYGAVSLALIWGGAMLIRRLRGAA